MNIAILLRVSLRSLKKHKGRSFLTTLGIIIGITAIIATLAIGRGAEEKTKKQLLSMGNNYVVVHSGSWLHEGKTTAKKKRRFQWLEYKDVDILKKLCRKVRHISPSVSTKNIVTFKTNSIQADIKGGNEKFLKILNRKIKRGMFFTKSQADHSARVAVIGKKAATELFNSVDPIGKTIRIREASFTVVGIIKEVDNFRGVHDPNFDIIAPIRSVKKHIHKSSSQIVHQIVISAPTRESIPFLVRDVRKVMRYRRKIKEGEPDNFTIIDQESIMKVAGAAAATIRLLLLIIASISLLVGGVGIMNIMLVSVTERTREIGIRMALGATSKLILRQFLIEAITLCLIGGIIGTLLGIAIPHGIAKLTKWSPIVTTGSIVAALITTSAIGIFFGFYPARKASRLNPVEALAER
jgi:putative ABC transport system permease protein